MSTTTHATIPAGFWRQITAQLDRIATEPADTFDKVRAVLLDPAYYAVVSDVNLNGARRFDADTAFFAGSGGDDSLYGALRAAGWRMVKSEAFYYYVAQHPESGDTLTYCEGDVYRGDQMGGE